MQTGEQRLLDSLQFKTVIVLRSLVPLQSDEDNCPRCKHAQKGLCAPNMALIKLNLWTMDRKHCCFRHIKVTVC